ncbi:MAG: MFS transporter [Thermomicrobiales bacterium]|nr:MFS transporter [Thermomicrobiales bacterium]
MIKRLWGRDVVGWVVYDFATVLFSITVMSLYFPLWVVDEAGGRDRDFALVSSISMAIVLVLAPFVGALSDRLPRRMPMLIGLTLVSAVATALLGSGGLKRALVLFVIANVFYLLAILVYEALLPEVSTAANRGRVSGWGFAAGFGGSLAGILMGMAVLAIQDSGHPTIFLITGVFYFIFAVPCFRWVREKRRGSAARIDGSIVRDTLREVRASIHDSRQAPGFGRFLIGRFFYADAINTAVIFMGIYATEEVGMSDLQVQLVLLVGIIIGPLGALWSGSRSDRNGPKRTLNVMLVVWAAALTATALVPLLDLPIWLFWIVAPLIGIGLGGTSTAERAWLMRLIPPTQVGRFLGLNAMIGRFSAIVSPLLWVLVADLLGLGRPVAVLSLIVMLVIARIVLDRLDDDHRVWPVERIEGDVAQA